MPFVERQDVSIYCLQEGDGPAIVWIPGGDGTADFWLRMMSYFPDYRSTAFDPCGAGRTVSQRPRPWTIRQFAQDCAAVIEELCEPPVVVVGVSMGALIAQQVAIDFPSLTRSVIAMGTCAKATGFCRDWMQAEIDMRRAGTRLPTDFAVAHYAGFYYPPEVLGNEKLWAECRDSLYGYFRDRNDQDFIDQWQACLDYDVTVELARCEVPIHAIAFDRDVAVAPALVRRVADLARRGFYHELAGMGHLSCESHRVGQTATCIRDILERYVSPGA